MNDETLDLNESEIKTLAEALSSDDFESFKLSYELARRINQRTSLAIILLRTDKWSLEELLKNDEWWITRNFKNHKESFSLYIGKGYRDTREYK